MKTIQHLLMAGGVAALLAAGGPAFAQAAGAAMPKAPTAAGAAAEMADADVRKVDKEQGKITLRHGPIPNLDMPGMTMVFYVKDKAMLENVKAGDKIRFKAINDNGKMTVSEIKAAP